MYYTAALKSQTNLHCVSYATSKTVTGPYTDTSTQPWICPTSEGGAIDPAGYTNADGTRWVTYKIDGNAIGHGGECGNTVAPIVATPLMLQQVAQDGRTKIGSPVQILTNGVSDGAYIESPSLTKLGGKYVLFFSPQCFRGPYTRRGQLLATGTAGLKAPGGLDIAINGDHAIWHGDFGSGRAAYTGILAISGNTVTVQY
jgi:beta-xylosidase